MNKQPYMSAAELISWLKLGVLCGEAETIAEQTTDKDCKEWRRKLKTVSTYLNNIVMERLKFLDKKQLMSVQRRKDHTNIVMLSSDKRRMDKSYKDDDSSNIEEEITLATEDLYDVVDMALLSCFKCPQGGCVKNCRIRPVYHRIGVPPIRTAPKDGECEFRLDNEIACITPQYQKITERI